MATAMDVANYFLTVQKPENDITNLKLQKLCAYAQAMSLTLLNRPLFDEPLEAWLHGPVVPSLYYQYERYANRPLPSPGLSEHYAREPFDDEAKFILELVSEYYGRYSAWTLRERSHNDFPGDFGSKHLISHDAIRAAFLKDPVVLKLSELKPCHFDPAKDTLVPESEVFDVLGI